MGKDSHHTNEKFDPNVKAVLIGLVTALAIAGFLIFVFIRSDRAHAGVVRTELSQRIHNAAAGQKHPNIAIVTAYRGLFPGMVASLADLTKRKYSQLHGYTFYVDNHMWKTHESTLRASIVLSHLRDHTWVFWTEPETFVVDPSKRLVDLIDDNYHVIMSKDWGGRQLCPATMMFRNSEIGEEIATAWHDYVKKESGHDDLRSWLSLLKDRPDYERYIKWVDQHELAAYPDLEFKDGSYKKDTDAGHAYYRAGDRMMHMVNCIRDGKHDSFCCAGIGAHYYRLFEENMDKALEQANMLRP